MVMKKTVGEKIRSFRQQKKLTQEQLALGAEINPVFLGHLERNLGPFCISTWTPEKQRLPVCVFQIGRAHV